MKERLFRFKQFNVSHSRSALPIGVDGVLIGAWGDCSGQRLLDVGCGCGVIALMLAQRNPDAEVYAIDIHEPSVEESNENFLNSPWSKRLKASLMDFSVMAASGEKFDRIVSNPPFFNSGVNQPSSARLAARHQGGLSPATLIEKGSGMLTADGRISMIVPSEMEDDLDEVASRHGLQPVRKCLVRDHETSPYKRIMLEYGKNGDIIRENITMFEPDGTPTDRYRYLCGQFYLKF